MTKTNKTIANNSKNSNNRKNNNAVRKNNKTNSLNKKHNTKKKTIIPNEINQEINEVELVKKPAKKNNDKSIFSTGEVILEKKELTQDEIIAKKKERNRRKYQNKQKKYHDNKKNTLKKKIIIPDEDNTKSEKTQSTEEELVKKPVVETNENVVKEKERKEKRKLNRKSVHLTQTLANIKDKSVSKINLVKEKTNDQNIPVGKTQEEKSKRFKRIIKEAIFYAIILTIINIICILVFDYFNFLRLFDIKALNIVITIILSLIFNFFIAFMIDYFITNIWLRKKRKKKVDDLNGDNRINEGEYQEDIPDKKRK